MTAKKRLTAKDLIAATGPKPFAIPDELRRELKLLLDHNRGKNTFGRVGRTDAIKLCAEYGVKLGPERFERMIQAEFGCKWGRG